MSHQHDDVPLRILGWNTVLQALGVAVGLTGLYLSHSLALWSDVLHWIADVVPAGLTWGMRAAIQQRRRSGHGQHFELGVLVSGTVNAIVMMMAGIIGVFSATSMIDQPDRKVTPGWALGAAITGLVINLAGHWFVNRHSAGGCAHDSRFDIRSLAAHLKIDIMASALAIAFILLNTAYRATIFDTVGGIFLGWFIIGYGLWILAEAYLRHHTKP